jgi:hypothetical protein
MAIFFKERGMISIIKQHMGCLALGAVSLLLPVTNAPAEELAKRVPPSVIQQINPPAAIRSGAIVLDPSLHEAVNQKMLDLMEETMLEILSEMGMTQGKEQQLIFEQIRNNFLQNRLQFSGAVQEEEQNEAQ